MIYRCHDEIYTFVYWDKLVLRFGTTTQDRIGRWDEELTCQFRGQIAIFPDYVEKCIADWVMQPKQQDGTRPEIALWKSRQHQPPKVQKRLFPEYGIRIEQCPGGVDYPFDEISRKSPG